MPDAKISLERRVNPRLSIKIPVKYRLVDDKKVIKGIDEWRNSEKNAYTLDMGLGGMQLAVDKPLAVGNVLEFDLYLLDKSNTVSVFAQVVWSNQAGAGLKFLMMKPGEAEALKSFLEKASSGE